MPRDFSRMPAQVLLVEDNPGDALLTREAFADGGYRCELHHVPDGAAALAFLRREPPFEGAVRPDLMLLDLNLPGKDGREVLREMRDDAELRAVPVVVLTTSEAERDVAECYRLQASCFVTKPVDLDAFFDIIRDIERFWFGVVALPG